MFKLYATDGFKNKPIANHLMANLLTQKQCFSMIKLTSLGAAITPQFE
jgi:hypothetical protein